MLKWKLHFILVLFLLFLMKRTFCFKYDSIIACGLTEYPCYILSVSGQTKASHLVPLVRLVRVSHLTRESALAS